MNKLVKRIVLLSGNLIGFIILIYFQNNRIEGLLNIDLKNNNQEEVLRNAGLIHAAGSAVNWIIGLSLFFFVINLLLYKNWIKNKRWILEPIIVLFISIGVMIFYYFTWIN